MCWGDHQYYCKKRRLHLARPRHYRRDNKPLRKADYGEYSETEEEEDRKKQEEYDRKYDEKIAEKKKKKKEAKELQKRLADIPEQGNETVAPNSDHPSSSDDDKEEDDDDDDELADGRSEESYERYLLYMWDDGISVNEDSEIEKNQGVLHWNTARRWVDKKMKNFLEAVIE